MILFVIVYFIYITRVIFPIIEFETKKVLRHRLVNPPLVERVQRCVVMFWRSLSCSYKIFFHNTEGVPDEYPQHISIPTYLLVIYYLYDMKWGKIDPRKNIVIYINVSLVDSISL